MRGVGGEENLVAGVGHQFPWILLNSTSERGDQDVVALHARTGELRTLAATAQSEGDGWLSGEMFYFARGRFGDEENGSLEIWRKDLRTDAETRLTSNDWNDYELRVSPDGTHLCWQSEEKGHYGADIVVMNVESGTSWTPFPSRTRTAGCRWTPNSEGLFFIEFDEGHMSMMLQPVQGGEPIEIAPFGGYNRPIGFLRKATGPQSSTRQ
jgi:hypothetical protein